MFFTNLFESNLRVRDFAKQIIYYTSTQSTNDDIWSLFNDNNKENILVVTDNQLNGRGRLNNRWFSKPGHSITCSFLLNEVFDRNHFSLHSILIPVAIINGVKNFLSINLETKWPNDIMYHNKKIGGILLESKYNKKALILNVGIGLNVNEDNIDFPIDIQSNCTSLKEIKGHPIQREPLLAFILNELDILINNLDIKYLIKIWTKSCMHINSNITFKDGEKIVTGVFKHINEKGEAVILHNNNNIAYSGMINLL